MMKSNTKRLTLSKKPSTKELKHALFDVLKGWHKYIIYDSKTRG